MTCTLKVFIGFEKDNELLDNPEYVTLQHTNSNTDQNHQHIIFTAKPKNNPETEVFPHSTPVHSSMSIYQF